MGVNTSGGRWGGGAVVRGGGGGGCCVRKRKVGEGLMAKMKKSSRWGSISGVLSEMEVDISGVSQWGGADKAAVAVGRCVRKREAGEQAEGQKSGIEPLGLD